MAFLTLLSSAILISMLHRAHALSISDECQSALLGVAGSPEATCMNVGGLINVFAAPTDSSLVQPLSNWLSGACAEDPCTNDQIESIVTNITTGCGGDLSTIGVGPIPDQSVIQVIQEAYPTVRSIACLTDTTNNTLCATSLLTDLESAIGPLSVENVVQQLPLAVTGQLQGLPVYAACSDCVKAAYNVLAQDQPEIASNEDIRNAFEQQCGASFLDGSDPTQIIEGTGSAAPTAGAVSGAVSTFVGKSLSGVGAVMLATVAMLA